MLNQLYNNSFQLLNPLQKSNYINLINLTDRLLGFLINKYNIPRQE